MITKAVSHWSVIRHFSQSEHRNLVTWSKYITLSNLVFFDIFFYYKFVQRYDSIRLGIRLRATLQALPSCWYPAWYSGWYSTSYSLLSWSYIYCPFHSLRKVLMVLRWQQSFLLTAISPRGGGGTASLKVGTHCQTTAPAFWPCPLLSFLWPPPVFEGHRPPPPKIRHPQYKISYKTDPKYFSKLSIQWIPCISQNRVKTNTSYKLLPLLGSQFEVDRPPFLPSEGLTAPRFCRSPPPLRAAVWQWVVIQYLSAPPGNITHLSTIPMHRGRLGIRRV